MKIRISLLCVVIASLWIPNLSNAEGIPNRYEAKIVLDPGHGGIDSGATGVNRLHEADVTLDISRQAAAILRSYGYSVKMTRESRSSLVPFTKAEDKYNDLQARVDLATNWNADVFVSVHANSWVPSDHGTMVLYYDQSYTEANYPASKEMAALTPENRRLSQSLLTSVTKAAGTKNLSLVPSRAYVVRMGTVPAALVETAFLSNRTEAAKLASAKFRKQLAIGIANGISDYLPLTFYDIGHHWAKASIIRLVDRQWLQGTGNHQFMPDRAMTREEVAATLFRTGQMPANVTTDGSVSDSVYHLNFNDLTPKRWSYDALIQAVKAGVLEGYPDGTMRPDQKLTRAEFASIIVRMGRIPLSSPTELKLVPFTDVKENLWAYSAIQLLYNDGIISGKPDGTYAVNSPVTRAEAAKMLDLWDEVASLKSNN